MILAQSWTNLF